MNTIKPSNSFAMDQPIARRLLIAALRSKGLPACEINVEGSFAVAVPLTEETPGEGFFITASDDIGPCQVELTGWRTGAGGSDEGKSLDCLSSESCMAASLQEAVAAFNYLWSERVSQVQKFRSGVYDLAPEMTD